MSYAVGRVAGLAGVTLRTLHHYDEIGLLSPRERSRNGYRRYGEADLERLQQILYYRELGFSLEEIAAILDDPRADAAAHLRRQHRLLRERIARLEAGGEQTAAALAAALRAGTPADDDAVLDLAEAHRQHITRWFYDCSYEVHRGLGDMYTADDRFRAFYERIAPGLAEYLRDAIHANASRNDTDTGTEPPATRYGITKLH